MVRGPYWVAGRVCAVAAAQWEAFDGTLALNGVDPLALPLHRMVNAFLVFTQNRFATQEGGEEKWTTFVTEIYSPPARVLAEAQAPARALRAVPAAGGGQAFEAFARAHAQGPPTRG